MQISAIWRLAAVLWILAMGSGFAVMLRFQNTAGAVGRVPLQWPPEASQPRDAERFTLVLFAHPQCPCTRSSIHELNRLLARTGGRLTARVLFFQPDGFAPSWTQDSLWSEAAAIRGVTVLADSAGRQATLFGAATSGQALLYDAAGRLRFQGGITAGRGHAGDNAGEDAIVAIVNGGGENSPPTEVFGCSLMGECASSGAGNGE